MSPCALNNIGKIRTVCVYALFYYAFSHLRKYGWACPSRNGIRIQSDITVSTSNIHEGASGSHRIAENHNAYTQLTRFRAESLYWMAFVLYVSTRTTTCILSFRFHRSLISWPHRSPYTEDNNSLMYIGRVLT